MACTAQELVNAQPCFACLTEQQGDWTLLMNLCMATGGTPPLPPDDTIIVIGGEGNGADTIIIGGEGGGMLGPD